MPLTYEQLAPSLYKQARKLVAKSHGRFQTHELVNACWLRGNVQKLKTIKFASKRAYYDMIDYIRDETGLRNDKKAREAGKFVPNAISLHTFIGDEELNGTYFELQETLPGITDRGQERIDTKDLFERLCRGLDWQDALALKLRFIEGFDLEEIGRTIGLTGSRISQLLKNMLPRLKVILENLQANEKMNRRKERPPEKKAEYERLYRNECISRKKHALAVVGEVAGTVVWKKKE